MKLLATALIFLVTCAVGWTAELAPFAPPWDDATPGPSDISGTLDKPAGKAGFVHVKDGHLYTGDQRLRLFGANLTAAADFPDHNTADKVAARMAKFGLNAVRFHFLDSTWGTPKLINYESGDWRNWNADTLDRLDYFIARLKEHGIYADLNLLVGRRFGVGDAVDATINQLDWKAAHAVGFFHAPHLEAQQRYARKLLTHLNPYTKLTYAADPAVALVEINNENGLIHTWLDGSFDTLPEVFARDLQNQWNDWLGKRYAGTAALATAWGARDEPLAAEMLANARLTRNLAGWDVEQHEGAAVDAAAEGGTIILRVRKPGTAGWHVQFSQSKLAIKPGAVYTVSFRAAADRPRKVSLSIMQAHEPWGNLGLQASLALTPKPQFFTFTFIATAGDANARLSFSDMNQAGAEFRLGELSLKAGGRVGLNAGETLEKRNLRTPKVADSRTLPAGGRQDWIRFLWETERKHWTGMRRFLKDEVGVKVPIVGTIVATSTPNLMADLDVVDSHAYWQHPSFPGKSWDMNNWFVKNISMVDYPDGDTMTRLAFQRVAGKPHMVSEYNHPAPNTHAGEGPLFAAAFGALQDWDAIFLYTYSHEERETKAGYIPGFFSIGPHPTIMANVPVASLLFRRGDLRPATQVLHVPLPAEKEIELIAQKGHAWGVVAVEQLGLDLKNAIMHRIALDVSGKSPLPAVTPVAKAGQTSDTGELAWRLPGKDRGVLELRGAKTKVVIGHVDQQRIDLGHDVQVTVGQTRSHWCTVALTLLEGDAFDRNPRRALLVATGVTENTNMGWQDAARSTVGQDWGKPPSLVEPIAATIQVPRGAAMPVLYPLNDRGQRGRAIPTTAAGDGAAQFTIGPPHGTVWYELDYAALPSARVATVGPREVWRSAAPESQGFSSAKLASLRADLAARRTTAFLVARNDAIVCEWYAPGVAADTKNGTASLAKAIVGGVSLAVALSDGRLALDDPAAKFIPPWRDDARKSQITLRQLGSHTSGIEDAEADDKPHEQLTGWKGDFWKRRAVPNDPFSIARDRAPAMFAPGTKMEYSNPGIALLTWCVTAALRDAPQKDIRTLLRERVMRPIGVGDAEWSVGYNQTFTVDGLPLVPSWGGAAYTARAAARVGRLMLRGGDWDGRRILSAQAVRATTSAAGTPGPCGIGWWSNNAGDCAKLPRDAYFGSGAGHKILLVVPSLHLIVVRCGAILDDKAADSGYHDAYRKFLFEPLMEAITDVAPGTKTPLAEHSK